MVEPYHGYKYVKKGVNNINSISITTNPIPTPTPNPQNTIKQPSLSPSPTSGLPVLIPAGLGLGTGQPQINKKFFNQDKYRDLLVEKPVIKYLPPEIIPKESVKKSKSKVKSKLKSKSTHKSKSKSKPKRIRSYDYQKEKEKGAFFDKDVEKQSLLKYKFDPQNPNPNPNPTPTLNSNPEIQKPVQKKEQVKMDPSELAEKRIMMMKPYIIPVENPDKSSKKKISNKKKSMKQMSKKLKKDDPQAIINNIDETDESYKIKFDKLKKAYIKKHKTLMTVFDGYQHLYDQYATNPTTATPTTTPKNKIK